MNLKSKLMAPVIALLGMISAASAAIDVTNLTTDINAALDVFWLLPQSIVDHFGILITLILLGAIIGMIYVVLNFIKKLLISSTNSTNRQE